MLGQHPREGIAAEESMFFLAQRREWIEPLQFGVDKAWMAHDHAAVRKPVKKARK
jgi:hypothetical protein